MPFVVDPYSYSNPNEVLVTHADIDWEVSFQEQKIKGAVILALTRTELSNTQKLILDTDALDIASVMASDGKNYQDAVFVVSAADPIKGRSLTITLNPDQTQVRIRYTTQPQGPALQWLTPQQTTDKQQPMLYTLACPSHARSLLPIQDTPQVKVTYSASVAVPNNLMAVMGAHHNPQGLALNGHYEFEMPQAISPYLISLAVGDFKFKAMQDPSCRTGIYAEASQLKAAEQEFNDLTKMMTAAESLFGPYLWRRYDLLMMPSSFPAGGMENPLLAFLSPTLITGDKSSVSTLAHELAHAWFGNLISNQTWNHLWLNEGLTTYAQNRIVEKVYGKKRADLELALSYLAFKEAEKTLKTSQKILDQTPYSPNPDEAFVATAYLKGLLFFKQLETLYGRTALDAFLKKYIQEFKFKTLNTADFESYLDKHLLMNSGLKKAQMQTKAWLHNAELPNNFKAPSSEVLKVIDAKIKLWLWKSPNNQSPMSMIASPMTTQNLHAETWQSSEWLYFLSQLMEKELPLDKLKSLDSIYHLTDSKDAAVMSRWLLLSLKNKYNDPLKKLEAYLLTTGKVSLIKPIYQELVKTPAGFQLAVAIYKKAQGFYHPFAVKLIEPLLAKPPKADQATKAVKAAAHAPRLRSRL